MLAAVILYIPLYISIMNHSFCSSWRILVAEIPVPKTHVVHRNEAGAGLGFPLLKGDLDPNTPR
jgi:hypothetical protein